jgi:hypothetical protein
MPLFDITATRETTYQFAIEADTEEEALEEVSRIELTDDIESYASDWYPLEITDIEEAEELE